MCMGEGQAQAGLLRRGLWWVGLRTSARISLMEGVLPLRLWQPNRLLVKEGCCEGIHGRMREHGAPAVDQGVGEGVVQKGSGLAG